MKYKTNVLENRWRGSARRIGRQSEIGIRICKSFTNEMPSVVAPQNLDSTVMSAILSKIYENNLSAADRDFYRAAAESPAYLMDSRITYLYEGTITHLMCTHHVVPMLLTSSLTKLWALPNNCPVMFSTGYEHQFLEHPARIITNDREQRLLRSENLHLDNNALVVYIISSNPLLHGIGKVVQFTLDEATIILFMCNGQQQWKQSNPLEETIISRENIILTPFVLTQRHKLSKRHLKQIPQSNLHCTA